ncbi:MAG: DeoR/GlpR family DNA-binding transcription regulator [Pseudomonadota bacterium]
MDLNNPETRQDVLGTRLRHGGQIVAADVASEFGVSLDTIRRDIIALETAGRARRVRGGAVPVLPPAPPLQDRLAERPAIPAIAARALARLEDCATLMLDGGATVLAIAERLPPRPGRLVITPSPWVALACQRNGVEVFMIGGRLSASGGVNVGEDALLRMGEIRADVAVLGACALDAEYGLGADDFDESRLKQAMHDAAASTMVVTDQGKIGLAARFRALASGCLDLIVTDAMGPHDARFSALGVEVDYA